MLRPAARQQLCAGDLLPVDRRPLAEHFVTEVFRKFNRHKLGDGRKLAIALRPATSRHVALIVWSGIVQ